MKRCIVGIRQPEGSPPKGSETLSIWFPSLASLAAVLSDDNRRLLRLIHDKQPKSLTELAELSAARHAARAPLRITGGGTRVQMAHLAADDLNVSGISGVVTYAPGEMTLIARAGTPLAEIETMLAAEGQALAFEPPDLRGLLGGNGVPTIGGVVAANASGSRRLFAGACRDHLLGLRLVDGRGRVLKNGGRVMKNVTGLDLGKLICGAHGTLGVLTEVALKTLPLMPERMTLAIHGVTATDAV